MKNVRAKFLVTVEVSAEYDSQEKTEQQMLAMISRDPPFISIVAGQYSFHSGRIVSIVKRKVATRQRSS